MQMRSRWFHKPVLHIFSETNEKKVTWLELFYDLIFVAAFIQLGNGLSKHVSIAGFAAFAGIFATLWLAWTGFTFFVNRYTLDDFMHRIMVFLQMFSVGGMAVSAADVLDHKPLIFILCNVFAQTMVAMFYVRSWKQDAVGRKYSQYWGSVFGLGAVVWLISAFVPEPINYILWGIGMLTIFLSPLNKHSRALGELYPIDFEHLSERYGLLTIIVLGESFVKVLSSLSQTASLVVLGQATVALLITCCIWWIYFDDVAGAKLKEGGLGWLIWLYAHLPLQIAIIAIGVGIKKAVFFSLSDPVPVGYGGLLCSAIGLALLSVAAIDMVTERRQAELSDKIRVSVRFFSGVLLLLLAPNSFAFNGFWFLIIITTICLLQVIFDLAMAPFEDAPIKDESLSTSDLLKMRDEGAKVSENFSRNIRISESIRKGTPNEFRKDIYFFLMQGGWGRVFLIFLSSFIAINLFFAALYMLQPGSITQAHPFSFADAFFFSVQTMSTIGYGAMAPNSIYGDVLVTIEAFVGIMGVALFTGLMFTKAARPKASVIFSKNLILTRRHGKDVLMFRAGNARGNDVVDATLDLSALIDDISPEGDHLRRIHDLKLSRSRSPFFTLSWAAFHEIDENSPLKDVDWKNPEKVIVIITSVLKGHDGTYGQTIYSRHLYAPDDILINRRFVDVISQMPDGRLMIDYHKFHDTEEMQPVDG